VVVTINIPITLVKDVTPYSLVQPSKYFRGTHILHLQDRSEVNVLQMQAASSCETLITFCQTTRSHQASLA
jgi:hypothetical protein